MKPELTAERLREVLAYDPATGVWTWLVARGGRKAAKVGDVAGCSGGCGYRLTRVHGTLYKAHRLAWLWMTGEWPKGMIDHVNGERGDNRWSNLREATNATNMQNVRRARTDSKLGLLGVSPHQGKFRAQIEVDGRKHHLGTFDTPEQAHEAYLAAKRRLHPGNTI